MFAIFLVALAVPTSPVATADHECPGAVEAASCMAEDVLHCTGSISRQIEEEIAKLNQWASDQVHEAKCMVSHEVFPNASPSITIPTGPGSGTTASSQSYCATPSDPDQHDQLKVTFDWGDGSTTTTGWVSSGTQVCRSHSWSSPDHYTVKARAMDDHGATSNWRAKSGSVDIRQSQSDCDSSGDAGSSFSSARAFAAPNNWGDVTACDAYLEPHHNDKEDWFRLNLDSDTDLFRVTIAGPCDGWKMQAIRPDGSVDNVATGNCNPSINDDVILGPGLTGQWRVRVYWNGGCCPDLDDNMDYEVNVESLPWW